MDLHGPWSRKFFLNPKSFESKVKAQKTKSKSCRELAGEHLLLFSFLIRASQRSKKIIFFEKKNFRQIFFENQFPLVKYKEKIFQKKCLEKKFSKKNSKKIFRKKKVQKKKNINFCGELPGEHFLLFSFLIRASDRAKKPSKVC